jgi:2-hydroxychromene-2-carboxylate isomerase
MFVTAILAALAVNARGARTRPRLAPGRARGARCAIMSFVSPPAPVFFFGAMSPYSWLAAERIARVLPQARWRGVFLGGLFKANGRASWGLTERRGQGLADCAARARERGLGPIRWPDPWPTNDLLVARAMVHAEASGVLEPFALSAMRLAFLDGRDLAEPAAVIEAGRRAGIGAAELEAALQDPAVKDALRGVTDEAIALGVPGVPTVALGTQLFWGDDRLQEAARAYSELAGA